MGSVFGPVIPVCRLGWYLYTFCIYAHFSQQLLMTQIWYLVTSFILVPHIVGSVFGPIKFLLPVCRLCYFYTHWTYMLIFRCSFLSKYWWLRSDIWSQASYSGKCFWTHRIPTSCLPTLLIFIHIEHTFCICPFFSATIAEFAKCVSPVGHDQQNFGRFC